MNTLHYYLMADHSLFHKALFASIKSTGLTSGQPKVLDYLADNDGAVQKDIAAGCCIEPATLTNLLNGMEKDIRKMTNVFLNDYSVQKRLKGVGILYYFAESVFFARNDFIIRRYVGDSETREF